MNTAEKPTRSEAPTVRLDASTILNEATDTAFYGDGKPAKSRLAALIRWLHIYLSMATFALVFFFAVTGLTLNHADWFYAGKQKIVQHQGKLEPAWVKPSAAVAKLEIVEHLRRAYGIKGAVSDFRIEDAQCTVSFKGPGYTADTFINRETGAFELTETRMGFVAVLNDLHKGRDSGRTWSLLIDCSAVLMAVVSITGLGLIFFLKRRLATGLLAAGLGTLISVLVYYLWVT